MRSRSKGRRKEGGTSLIETMAGLFILLPIVLAAIDIAAMVITAQQNEQLADAAARAAASTGDPTQAKDAADDAIASYKQSTAIDNVDYNQALGRVEITTVMTIRLPIPFMNFTNQTFRATAIQPIVSMPAPR